MLYEVITNLSVANDTPGIVGNKELEDKHNVTFLYDWDVAGGKIIQKEMTVTSNNYNNYMKFFAERDFDDAGRRISETWRNNFV